ncbi:hypothetical protein D3C72_1920450 [compost metagenome]
MPIGLKRVRLATSDCMGVSIDQPRHDRVPLQVDDLGARTDVTFHVAITADRENPPALYGNGGCSWRLRILRQQQAIAKNNLRILGKGGTRQKEQE